MLAIERAGFALGARITGIDLRRIPDAETIARLRAAWLEHLVVYFPGQDLTPEQLIAITKCFGSIDDNRSSKYARDAEYPEMMRVRNLPDGKPFGGYRNGEQWHSDLSTTLYPTSASFLYCKQLPKVGGDTAFANQYMAFESLSPGLRETLERCEAVHDNTTSKGSERRSPAELAEIRRLKPPIVHPAVRIHPETGRRALYLSERVDRFKDWTAEESRPLLDFLVRHAVRDEFCYRHRWHVGDLAMWDNRCVLHKALGDYDMWNEPREMLRTSVLGERSGYVLESGGAAPLLAVGGLAGPVDQVAADLRRD